VCWRALTRSRSCVLTRLAVLRLLTSRVAMNGAPVTPKQALQACGQLGNDPRAVHVESEPAAHALALDYEVTTFDRGFKSFRGLTGTHTTALEEIR
jgi:hypothetical protein